MLAIEFSDAEIAVLAPGGLVLEEPVIAAEGPAGVVFGHEAARQAVRGRSMPGYLAQLSEAALPRSIGPHQSTADLAEAQLAAAWARAREHGDAVLLVVGYRFGSQQLSLLLGICEALGIPVRGLVDAAVAATRRRYPGRELLHLEAGHDSIGATRIEQNGEASRGEVQRIEGPGIASLRRACVAEIAACFIRQTRFDPLHDAASEQALLDNLPQWLAGLAREPRVHAELSAGGRSYAAELEAQALGGVVRGSLEPVAQWLRARAGTAPVLQLGHRLSAWPGVAAALAGLGDVISLEPRASLAGALARAAAFGSAGERGGEFRLVTRLPFDLGDAELAVGPAGAARGLSLPTHLLYRDRLFRLGDRPFHVGTALADGEYGLDLDGAAAGVSRQHLVIEPGEKGPRLVDHSRYGTHLNGHRVESAAALVAGDRITLGEPPLELLLVREES